MAKKEKQHRPAPEKPIEDSAPVTPPGASFDTEEGRAAHGMRKDLGGDPATPPHDKDRNEDDDPESAER